MAGNYPKELHFGEEGRKKLLNGMTKMAKAVKSTLGPRGNTVLIESQEHTHGLTSTKDGVTVAKSITLPDPVEDIAVRVMREASERTASSAGDGTTTAIVLAEAFINNGLYEINGQPDKVDIIREMNNISESVVRNLRVKSKKLTKGRIESIATISANNDPAIGRVISEAYKKVGRDGVVTVEKSKTEETYSTVTNGVKVDRGYSSRSFVTDSGRDECVYSNVHILVSDKTLESITDIGEAIAPIIKRKEPLLIIAPTSQQFLETMVYNKLKNKLPLVCIQPPALGWKQKELMEDIALTVGATFISEDAGDDLTLVTESDLGFADRIVVGADDSIITVDEMTNQGEVDQRVKDLKAALASEKRPGYKKHMRNRIGLLSGGIGVIYAGGNTDLEQKELYDRIDDSIQAVRSALEEGILPGAGVPLMLEGVDMLGDSCDDFSARGKALKIIAKSLVEPFNQILVNAGATDDQIKQIVEMIEKFNAEQSSSSFGYNVKTESVEDLYLSGVVDPTKVTVNALRNAMSVATTILSTESIITLMRTYESNE